MNKVILTGRVANDLELRATPTGSFVCDFNLATNRPVNRDGERVADFISCRVWNKQAENFVNYQNKGSLIAVFGELRVDNYEDKEGNRRSKTYVLVNSIEFLEKREKRETEKLGESLQPIVKAVVESKKYAEPTRKETDPYEEFGQQMLIDDESLPF